MKTAKMTRLLWNGRYYNVHFKNHASDIPFYVCQAKKFGGPILELACGTGRVTIPLAEQGFQIAGLDNSSSMLTEAKRKAAEHKVQIEWREADVRDFHLGKKSKLILFPFATIALLHDLESVEACFACVKEHLAEDGRFIFDYFRPSFDFLARDSAKRYPVAEYPDPDGHGQVVVTENNVYDAALQINHVKWYYRIGNQPEIVEDLDMRIFFPQELDALLHYNGLDIESKFGDFDETPFESSSVRQLFICHQRR